METLQVAVVVVGVAVSLAAFVIYNGNGSKISTGTWLTLVIGDALEASSFAGMTASSLNDYIPVSFAIGSLVTFWVALYRKRFGWPDSFDWFVVIGDTAITAWWVFYGTATSANLLYQTTAVISFIPMYRGLIQGTEKENPLPWLLWSLSFACFFGSVMMGLEKPEELVFPLVGFATHLAVYGLAKAKA